jgi:hypothetical protein
MVTRFKCLKLYVNKRSNVANLLGINPLKTDVFELKNTNSKSIHRLLLTPNRLLPNGKVTPREMSQMLSTIQKYVPGELLCGRKLFLNFSGVFVE